MPTTNSEAIFVDAPHAIFRDEPEVVIEAILDVIDMVNDESSDE